MKCLYCGADNMPGARFCGNCGCQLLASPTLQNAYTSTEMTPANAVIAPPPSSPPPPPPPPLSPPLPTSVGPKNRRGLWTALGAGVVLLALCIVSASLVLHIATSNQGGGPIDATATAGPATTATAVAAIQVGATATAIASNLDPYPPKTGTLALYDHLSNNSSSQWDEGLNNNHTGGCRFDAGMYHATESSTHSEFPCYADATNFSNFTFRVEMTIIRGDCGGLLLRGNKSSQQYYVFEVCQKGIYDLYTNGAKQYIIAPTSNAAIKQGIGQVNLIAVTASANTFTFYVNNTVVGSTTNDAYSQGQIGLVAGDYRDTTEVQYTEAKVWTL